MPPVEEFNLELTLVKIYKFKPVLGQGSCSIGIKNIPKGKYDILLEKDVPINWDAFNHFFTPAEEGQSEKYPYCNFPRFFTMMEVTLVL